MKLFTPVILLLIITGSPALSQTITPKLKFEQGQKFGITMETKNTITQQAMGQSIDFKVDATGTHSYTVTNATDDNTTLHHEVKKVNFSFDGMGQKRSFDSESEKDMKGPFGKPIKEMKEKPYDMVIDTTGIVLMAFPDKIKASETDSRMAIITNMLKEVMDIVQPPQKGGSSFFKVLPGKAVAIGDTWKESHENESGSSTTNYTLAAITDSTIIVDFTGTSSTVTKAEMMGNETTTTMNTKSSGKIVLDKSSQLVKEKTISMEGTGNTETSFGTLPVTSKTEVKIMVDKNSKE